MWARSVAIYALTELVCTVSAAGNTTPCAPPGNATAGTSDGGKEMLSATVRLFNTLLVTLFAVGLGFATVRLKFISPERGDTRGFGFFIGQIVFPCLVFKTVATATLGDVDWGVLLACTLGKAVVMAITWCSTFFFYQARSPKGQRMLNATVFATFVVSSNDFAIGFPVVQALYGEQANMEIYIQGNALIGSLLFIPIVMILFTIGGALDKHDKAKTGLDEEAREGVLQLISNIALQVALNPVIIMTLLGLVVKALPLPIFEDADDGAPIEFVHPISDWLSLVASPFAMCALFITGTSLKSLRLALVPGLLVMMKVVVCAFATYFFAGALTPVKSLENFSFLYGMIPSSSAPLIFANRFAPHTSETIASAILLGLMVAGPFMYGTAVFLQRADMNMTDVVISVHFQTSCVGLICSLLFLLMALVLGPQWGCRSPLKVLLFSYGLLLGVYSAAIFIASPQLGTGFCSAYNRSVGRTPEALLLGWLEQASVVLVFGLQWQLLLRKRGCVAEGRGLIVAVWTLVGSLALGLLVAFGTVPSVASEMCAHVEPKLAPVSLTGNLIWKAALLIVAFALYVASRFSTTDGGLAPACMIIDDDGAAPARAEAADGRFQSSSNSDGAEERSDGDDSSSASSSRRGTWDELSVPESEAIQEDDLNDAEEVQTWEASEPENIVNTLFLMQALINLMQLVNTFEVAVRDGIMGSFAVMLTLEHCAFLLRPLILLGVLLLSPKFVDHLSKVARGRLPACCPDSSSDVDTPRGLRRRSTVYFDVCTPVEPALSSTRRTSHGSSVHTI
mmetsp:Transcript_41877/g.135497  ORF Transcript_41877/g.135497 Transcript_41877/m.135497 type:complete len:793 (-) Transcript_41877:177-2555(-)